MMSVGLDTGSGTVGLTATWIVRSDLNGNIVIYVVDDSTVGGTAVLTTSLPYERYFALPKLKLVELPVRDWQDLYRCPPLKKLAVRPVRYTMHCSARQVARHKRKRFVQQLRSPA